MTPLTCYAVSPDGIRFETQEDEEDVILFLRQHIIVLVPGILLILILLLTPLFLVPFLLRFLTLPIVVPSRYFVVGTAFWYVMTFGVAIMSFLRWYYNIYIVTNKRVVDIDFLHLLYKEFSEARLDKVQDISFKSGGIFAAFFDYGDVIIETAGEAPNIEFISVPKPAKVVETISNLLEKEKGPNAI
jgi:membrane protein YdbS with pleckstrin-like domain